jgi:hypothetical protein
MWLIGACNRLDRQRWERCWHFGQSWPMHIQRIQGGIDRLVSQLAQSYHWLERDYIDLADHRLDCLWIVGFTKSLAREVGRRNIRVNVVCPGLVASPMTESMPDAS